MYLSLYLILGSLSSSEWRGFWERAFGFLGARAFITDRNVYVRVRVLTVIFTLCSSDSLNANPLLSLFKS
jgi:hypothetical protein